MKSNVKGQIAGQVFMYMMAVIVIGGIALIGYNAVKSITTKSCDAEKATFKTNIESLVEKYTSYGSVNKKTIRAPCGYETICFVDASKIASGGIGNNFCDSNLIVDSVSQGIQQNIFVMSSKNTIPIGYSELISLNATDSIGCLCIEQRNKNFYITFNGKGSTTELSRS